MRRQEELSRIQKTLQILEHRGPDDQDYFLERNIWLAAARLAIIDLSAKAHQPMISGDGNLIIVFNGEIYNYRELR
ncbi:MAG TPA: asparagine synthetase B, partial [Candidatus Dojkabacteria bacterium]|nr:asparagine synthetase B [Candidatus Dojkabacteria bacterium]